MGIFNSNGSATTRYFLTRESVANPAFTLTAGQVLRVDGEIPAGLQAFLTSGVVAPLPDPAAPGAFLAWLPVLLRDIRQIDAQTFAPPREEPIEVFLDEQQVCARFGWRSKADIDRATSRLAFPKPARRTARLSDAGSWNYSHPKWREVDVDLWAEKQRENLTLLADVAS